MKAIDKLIELREYNPKIVAIAKDFGGNVFSYGIDIPEKEEMSWVNNFGVISLLLDVEFDSDNWQECIVTINDLPNYEVKMMSISVQDYERLVQAEKTLENIKKFLS